MHQCEELTFFGVFIFIAIAVIFIWYQQWRKKHNNLFVMNTFKVITWPWIQDLMEKPGFDDNSSLINDEPLLSEYGNSAYFVRQDWLSKHSK
jgi:hypothetical protein